MRRTHATVMVALLAALLLAAGCGSEDEDATAAVQYKVLGGRLVWCSGGAEEMAVPGEAKSIGNNAFNNCGAIGTLTIPASVTDIMRHTFSGVRVGIIYFGGTYDDWDAMAEKGGFGSTLDGTPVICADGKTWTWTRPAVPDVPVKPDDWQVADGVVTAYTGTETTVTLPDGVTKIEAGAIPAGTKVIFHGSREQWDELAANGDLTGLTAFAVDDDGTLVGYQGSGADIVIPDGVTAIGGGVFAGCTGITTVTIPAGVTDIGDGAFSGCAGLTDIAIPASVTTIGDGAFSGCTSLEDITYGGTMEQLKELTKDSGIDLSAVNVDISSWVIRDGVLISYCGSDTDITIPDIVTAIGDRAFEGNAALTGVAIPEGVTSIGDGAFSGCTALTGIEIPEGVTTIGAGAFKDCTGLADMTIPASVTTIGTGALACGSLETVTFAGTVAAWRERSEGSGLGNDVTVICSDGMWPPTVYVASTGSDDNPGSRAKPFATIQKAVDKIIAVNDGASAYTIYVDGTLKYDASTYIGANGMADFSALDKNLTLTIQALSGTATLDANQKSRVINAAPASGKLNLTLDHLTVTGGNASDNGGGMYFGSTGGTLTISDGTTIKGNTASAKGGGVYVKAGTFTMTGGTISGNTVTASGGGVYVTGDTSASGSFIMKDGTISGNTAGNDGGGVCVFNGTFTMEGGTIRENKANGSSELFGGGGIYLYRTTASMPGGRFTLKGGTVSGNEAEHGGGIWANASSECAMEGGSFSGNKATYGGGAYIYPGCTFKMSGAAQFADDNDMYLHTYTGATLPTVQIAGDLSAESPVATITPSAYAAGTQVLSGTAATLAANCGKFEVSEAGWKIDGEGKLAVAPDIYVSEGGDDTSGKGSQSKPFATLQKAFDLIKTLNLSTVSYTIHISGTVKGKSELSADVSAQKISITGTTGAKLDGNQSIATLLTVSCSALVEITNLTLTNSRVGGLYVKNGADVTIGEGAAISKNSNVGAGAYGGGVRNEGKFTMKSNAKISENYLTGSRCPGGGVYSNGTFIMEGGEISGNYTSTNYSTGYGGGVCIVGGTFEMTGGTISGNRASSAGTGGGVYFGSGTFTMTGGTISGNTASKGNGVCAYKSFNMSGAAKIAEDNDVYLANHSVIRIADNFTAQSPVATITHYTYAKESVLSLASGGLMSQDICDKFAVTPQDDGTKWKIAPSGSNGVLEKDEVSTGGGISVTIPDLGTYTFYLVSGGSEVVDGSTLQSSATITLREVRRDGVALTASDGTFLIEMQDTSGISFSSAGISDASATGLPATIKMPPLPPVSMPLQVYVKVELTSGTVIDETISVTVEP